MTFYFSADGSLKFTNKTIPTSTSSKSSSLPSLASSSSSSSSSFSTKMKNAALSQAGKLTADDKKAILASNQDYQIMEKFRQKINEIASRKPRTFDDNDYTSNLTALKNYNNAILKQAKQNKKTS